MALSITQLSEYLSQLDFGPSMDLTLLQTEDIDQSFLWQGHELPWNGLSCLSIVCYVLKFCFDSDHTDVFDTIWKLNDLSSEYNAKPQVCDYSDTLTRLKDVLSKYENKRPLDYKFHYLPLDLDGPTPVNLLSSYERMLYQQVRERNLRKLGKRREIAETFVNDLLPKVGQFFTFLKGNGNLASFIHFLLQILNCESNHIRYEGLGSRILEKIQKWSQTSLRTSLNFLLTVLGDTPFQFTDMEQVNNLLTEFEVVANEVGSFIYSYFFHTSPVNAILFLEESLVLLQMVDLLNVKIEEHCVEFSELSFPVYGNSMNTEAADSLFIVESLLEDVQNFMTSRDHLTDEIKHQTTKLHEGLVSAQFFLEDNNVPDEIEIQELKIQIRDTAYEAEYLVNSFSAGDLPLSYFSLRLPMIIQKFELIRKRCKEIKKISGIKLVNIKENLTVEVPSQQMVLTPGVAVEFEDETMKILDELTGGSEDLVFICIYGMPGLGKTTLAKRLYNDRLITDRFDECVWCVASQTYHKRKVLIEILTSLRNLVDKDQISKMEDESLILEIYKTLFSRRYLIVIDDVWDSGVWNDLGRYFRNDRNRSRILFTTRIRDTAPVNSIFHTPPFLSTNQCWELLEKKVFLDEPCPTQLRDSGKRIAAKCNGLPLAVVVIAGTLANIVKEKWAWEKVEESLVDTFTINCMEILKLSYRHLPNHLKLCFLYLGVFKEDAKIPVKKLIRLWIAEGLIRKDDNKSQENVAEEYLMDLVNRSLVLVAETRSIGGVKSCSIHDLLHEMCLGISKEENFLCLIENNHSYSTHNKCRRLCVLPTSPIHLRPFSLHCRSFFGHLSDPASCLPQMKRLKVMELALRSHLNIFGKTNLIHLRYLVIDQIVPESVLENLVNLEVLCVGNTSHVDVSRIISQMVKLRHLHVKRAKFLTDCDSSKPNSLQYLSIIHIKNTNDYKKLRSLPHLQKIKCRLVSSLPDLRFLTELKSLEIGATASLIAITNRTINIPSSIVKLNLSGTGLPWEMMSILGKLPQLQSLKLFWDAFKGKEWTTSEDEFQKLRFLEIGKLDLEQWITMSEHFPRLRHLVIVSCNKLQRIPEELGDIPTLHTLEVHECSYVANISAIQVEQEQRENGNVDLQVIITNQRWSKEELVLNYKSMKEGRFSNETQRTSSSGVGEESVWPNNPLPRHERISRVHSLIGCDYCGMYPIVGDRYKCMDCTLSYDLCGDCYLSSTRYKIPGRHNQKHTSEHKFVIVTQISTYQARKETDSEGEGDGEAVTNQK